LAEGPEWREDLDFDCGWFVTVLGEGPVESARERDIHYLRVCVREIGYRDCEDHSKI